MMPCRSGDSDPSHYANGLEIGDPRATDPGNCHACGLLSEHRFHCFRVLVQDAGRAKWRTACSTRCLEFLRRSMRPAGEEERISEHAY